MGNRAKLRALAEMATPDAERTIAALRDCVEFYVSAFYVSPDGMNARPSAEAPVSKLLAFIAAASPSVVLELLDQLAAAERDRAAAIEMANLHIESSNRLGHQLAAVTAARDELADIATSMLQASNECSSWHETIAELRKAGQ